MDKPTIYANGLIHCSVCVPKDWTREQVERWVNGANPTGIASQWQVSAEEFKGGASNPSPCEKDPTRFHYLMNC